MIGMHRVVVLLVVVQVRRIVVHSVARVNNTVAGLMNNTVVAAVAVDMLVVVAAMNNTAVVAVAFVVDNSVEYAVDTIVVFVS